jgi:hypothetical protein
LSTGRTELDELGMSSSDDDVVASFLDSVRTEGLLTKFLEAGVLGLVILDILFLHGGLVDSNMGILPNSPGEHAYEANLTSWIDKLNAFKTAQVLMLPS